MRWVYKATTCYRPIFALTIIPVICLLFIFMIGVSARDAAIAFWETFWHDTSALLDGLKKNGGPFSKANFEANYRVARGIRRGRRGDE